MGGGVTTWTLRPASGTFFTRIPCYFSRRGTTNKRVDTSARHPDDALIGRWLAKTLESRAAEALADHLWRCDACVERVLPGVREAALARASERS